MNAPVTIEKRKPLTRREVIQLMLDQEGRCGCGCGVKLEPMGEGVIDEHWIALELGGSNDLKNRYLLRKPCAATKTAEKDAPAIGKVRRIEARLNGTRRVRKAIPQRVDAWGPKGSRKLPSRPFAKKADRPSLGTKPEGRSEP